MRVGAAIEGIGKLGLGSWPEERGYESQEHQMSRAEGARQQGWINSKEGDPGKSKARRLSKEGKSGLISQRVA